MSYNEIVEKLKKLKTLAERGEPNERENARDKLNLILKKYGISESEINTSDSQTRVLKWRKEQDLKTILCQVIWSVRNDAQIFLAKNQKEIHCEMTYTEYIEVVEKYKFYSMDYLQQKDLFMKAYIYRNKLHSQGKSDDSQEKKQMSQDELAKIMQFMSSINKGKYIQTDRIIELGVVNK